VEQAVPAELKLLGVAVVIGLVQLAWAAVAAARGQSRAWLLGPRDEPRALGETAGRLQRAYRNFLETFPLFAAAVVTADLLGKLGPQTLWGAGLYTAARALYAPLYAAGAPGLRTLVWAIGTLGLVLVVLAIFK
jgi:uncharacterized MAPEG superfamily protein